MQSEPLVNHTTPATYPAAARAAIGSACVLGIAAQYLLHYGPTGVGWIIWIALFGGGAVVVVRRGGFPQERERGIAVGIAVCASAIPSLRASPPLVALSLLVLVTAASLPLLGARSYRFGATPLGAQ